MTFSVLLAVNCYFLRPFSFRNGGQLRIHLRSGYFVDVRTALHNNRTEINECRDPFLVNKQGVFNKVVLRTLHESPPRLRHIPSNAPPLSKDMATKNAPR